MDNADTSLHLHKIDLLEHSMYNRNKLKWISEPMAIKKI